MSEDVEGRSEDGGGGSDDVGGRVAGRAWGGLLRMLFNLSLVGRTSRCYRLVRQSLYNISFTNDFISSLTIVLCSCL